MDTPPTDLAPDVMRELHRRHAEPPRRYHDWSHIEALLRHLAQLETALTDPQAVRLAVLFHDAVYDPRSADNEAQSAALLRECLAGQVAEPVLARAEAMILATARHQIPPETPIDEQADMALFLDMDLAILGAAEDLFDHYEAAVRHEYGHVPDAAFAAGRSAVLERFAARETLYFSDWGKARFEAAARRNIARSLARLAAS